MTTKIIFIDSEHIKIEARITVPDLPTNNNAPAIIISHPYGPLGGNMNNNVVVKLHKYFSEKGFLTTSFNFRGSGKSSGRTSWTGAPEQKDYQAVINHLLHNNNHHIYPTISHLFICGYSYGSMIASTMKETSIQTYYILISYPLSVIWALSTTKMNYFKTQMRQLIQENLHPVLIIYGDQDQFTSEKSYQSWINTILSDKDHQDYNNIQYKKLDDVDHFWFGNEYRLIEYINSWINSLSIL
ncbi:Alpha/Beta hydrolase protein [Cunninghamella echinulata]|nr:Alpha/Beta hydrolase protein [Cunninghamella echinulata]